MDPQHRAELGEERVDEPDPERVRLAEHEEDDDEAAELDEEVDTEHRRVAVVLVVPTKNGAPRPAYARAAIGRRRALERAVKEQVREEEAEENHALPFVRRVLLQRHL